MLTDLVVSSRGVVGAIGFNYRTGDIYLFKAKAVVTAAGMHNFGKQTVSALTLNGELTSAAYRAGATLYKLEMTHSVPKPKDYASEDLMRWVLSGGAHYVNEVGKEFLSDYVPKGLPARLQDLSIAFANEARETGGTYADVSQASPQDRHFLEGILSPDDLAKGMITWVPALSGGGGVYINACCKTSLSGLYAAGDNGGRPVIGSYNVNGIMISYAYVSGCFAGENAAGYASGIKGPHWHGTSIDKQIDQTIKNLTVCLDKSRGLRPGQIIHTIQEIIIPLQVTLIRNEKRLKNALNEIQRIKEKKIPTMKAIDLHDLAKAQSALSLVLLAELTLRSALFRQESRGFHYREDYPYTDNHNWLKNVMVKLEDGSPLVWAEDVPTPYLSPSDSTATPPGAKRTWGGSA